MSKRILLHFRLCGLEVGLVLVPLGAEVLFRGYGHVAINYFHLGQRGCLQFLVLFLVVLELFGVAEEEEVFQEEIGGKFGDVGEGVQEFLEDYALLAEVFVVVAREVTLLGGGERVAWVQGREDFPQ
jgi:hypothetical protein